MEIVIVICLLVVIVLLLQDKIVIKKPSPKRPSDHKAPELPAVMGRPKPLARQAATNNAKEGHKEKGIILEPSFATTSEDNHYSSVTIQEEPDDVSRIEIDLEEEEEELRGYGTPNGEDGFATGVTFEELSTVGALLQQGVLEPAQQRQAVDIVQSMQGTDLFNLLEGSIEDASQRIATLLDKNLGPEADSGSSTMRNKDVDSFDIGEFV